MLIRKITGAVMVAAILLTFNSCQKDKNGTSFVTVHLTDNPYNASEVNVDIKEVRVNVRDDDSGWMTLNTTAGVYNLLDLQNGVDTVLASGTVPSGSLKEIRFVLGDDNSIKIDNNTYPLTIPSGSESGLKIKIGKLITAPIDSLIIDFDAALSIHQDGPGDYKLSPVLKIK